MRPALAPMLFDTAALARLQATADVDITLIADDFTTAPARAALARAEILLTAWECPVLDDAVLAAAPALRAVVHAAGSVKHHITGACWDSGIAVSSAAAINAIPVAEYTFAAIIMANKRVLPLAHEYRRTPGTPRDWSDWTRLHPEMGNYRKTIGVVGCSRIGRRVIEMLRQLDVNVLVHDPYTDTAEAAAIGATLTDLDALIAASDVVTLHAPANGETRHLINRRRLRLMRDGATLINTSRGALVDQAALTDELRAGRLYAVIDVTEPEILPADHAFYRLPNVLLTPHIAGSLGGELRRIGDSAISEVERYARGLPFAWPVAPERLAFLA